MNYRILITGSCGLIGSALTPALESLGIETKHFDIRASGDAYGDVRDHNAVQRGMRHCDGVIHLAAISRVAWGESEPVRCWSTNVDGLRNVLDAAASSLNRPWVVSASSREVYGQPDTLPVTDDCPVRPVNVYGRSKAEGELLVEATRRNGLRACTVRLSNVYGSTADHPDRVIPAFTRGAVMGEPLRVDGAERTFEFTHIDDVTRGIVALSERLRTGKSAPPAINLFSGAPTTLGDLAATAIRIAGTQSTLHIASARSFDVSRFFGSPSEAEALLGWKPQVGLDEGLERLVNAYRNELYAGLMKEYAL